jgi:hypothetical protein
MTKTRRYIPSPLRFTRAWWLDGVRNAVFIVLITLLVWIYADMDVMDVHDYRATLLMTAGDSQEVAMLPPHQVALRFTLRGTRGALRAYQDFLEQKRSIIEYDVSRFEPGDNTVPIADVLNQGEILGQRGLLLISGAPSQIAFILDRQVRQTARIELDYTGAKLLGPPKIDPSEIFIRLTESDLSNIERAAGENGPITLKTKQLDLSNIPTGQEVTRQVDILPPPKRTRFPIVLETKTVSVTVKVEQRTDQKDITVSIQKVEPSGWSEPGGTWEQYSLVKKDPLEWRQQITVTGAKKDIERLRSEDVEAYVTLSEQDKAPPQRDGPSTRRGSSCGELQAAKAHHPASRSDNTVTPGPHG